MSAGAATAYIPDRDHIVWCEFDPALGHEQQGRRPALVLSPLAYNKTGKMVCVPITRQAHPNWPFMVPINVEDGVASYAISDQIKCLDWQQRKISFIRRAEREEAGRVRGIVRSLV